MTRQEATIEACAVFSLAYHSIGDYRQPADGFCDKCPGGRHGAEWSYQNAGHIFQYVRAAVIEKLKRDGHTVADGFDPNTGKEAK